jgi:hypothetical protein
MMKEMKQWILAAFVIAAVPSTAQVKYTVSGLYADDGKKVYLIDQLADKAIDSIFVADGKFSFTGTADKDALLAVKAENSKWTTEFFNDGTRNSLIPVAFAGYYFMENGVEAFDELVKQQVVFANHPYLKKTRDEVEAMLKPNDSPKTAFIDRALRGKPLHRRLQKIFGESPAVAPEK